MIDLIFYWIGAALYTFRQYLLHNKSAKDENLGLLWISDRGLGKGIISSLDYLIAQKQILQQ